MKALSKAQQAERDRIVGVLRELSTDLRDAIERFNEVQSEEWEKVQVALDLYNEGISEANEFRGIIADDMESHFDEKSERWQDSDAGQAYLSWKEQWQEEFPDANLDKPDSACEPDNADADDLLEGLADEP